MILMAMLSRETSISQALVGRGSDRLSTATLSNISSDHGQQAASRGCSPGQSVDSTPRLRKSTRCGWTCLGELSERLSKPRTSISQWMTNRTTPHGMISETIVRLLRRSRRLMKRRLKTPFSGSMTKDIDSRTSTDCSSGRSRRLATDSKENRNARRTNPSRVVAVRRLGPPTVTRAIELRN